MSPKITVVRGNSSAGTAIVIVYEIAGFVCLLPFGVGWRRLFPNLFWFLTLVGMRVAPELLPQSRSAEVFREILSQTHETMCNHCLATVPVAKTQRDTDIKCPVCQKTFKATDLVPRMNSE